MSDVFRVGINPLRYDTTIKGHRPYQWCWEKFGEYGKNWYKISYTNKDIYCFQNQDDYTLFLLTWG